jgi:hypothetical protein
VNKNILDDYEEWHFPKKEKPKKGLIPLSAYEYRNLSLSYEPLQNQEMI